MHKIKLKIEKKNSKRVNVVISGKTNGPRPPWKRQRSYMHHVYTSVNMYKHILYFSVRCINWPLYIILLYSTLPHMYLYYFGKTSFRLKNRNHKFVVLAKKIYFYFKHLSFWPNIFSYKNNTIRYITIVIQ